MQHLQGHWPEGWQTPAQPHMVAVHAGLRSGPRNTWWRSQGVPGKTLVTVRHPYIVWRGWDFCWHFLQTHVRRSLLLQLNHILVCSNQDLPDVSLLAVWWDAKDTVWGVSVTSSLPLTCWLMLTSPELPPFPPLASGQDRTSQEYCDDYIRTPLYITWT